MKRRGLSRNALAVGLRQSNLAGAIRRVKTCAMHIFRDRPIKDVSVVPDSPDTKPGEWTNRLAEENEFLLSFTRGIETAFDTTGDGLVSLWQKKFEPNRHGNAQCAGAEFRRTRCKRTEPSDFDSEHFRVERKT
jgi:hypothetical protein